MISKLGLKAFKNFREADLDLGPLSIMVGTNASGKSNLRDAFRFLHGMSRGYTLPEIIGEKYIEGGVLQWRGIRGGTREVSFAGSRDFCLTAEVDTGTEIARHSLTVELANGDTQPRVTQESLSTRQRTASAGWNGVYDTHWADDPPAQEGHPYVFVRLPRDSQNRKHGKRLRFLDSTPVLTQFCDHREAKRAYRDIVERVIDALGSMRFLDLSPDAMRIPSLPGQHILGDRGENLSSVLQAICAEPGSKEALSNWLSALTPLDVVDFEFVPDQTGRILVNLVEADERRTSAHSASDGTLRFLAMIAALLGPSAARFYFFEELENGIHPTRLHLLLQLIEQRVSTGRIQLVASSHSPQLLGFLSEEARQHASLVYRLEDTPDARIRRIVDIPQAQALLDQGDLGKLHASGWLEDAVAFVAADAGEAGDDAP